MKKTEQISISIIIPVLNERANLAVLLPHLRLIADKETEIHLAVADKDNQDYDDLVSADGRTTVHRKAGQSRAEQMHRIALLAQGAILWFVHADVLPHRASVEAIKGAYLGGAKYGWFSYRFDSDSRLLACNAWCTRWDGPHAGGGDQCLWVERSTYQGVGGFPSVPMMEDFEIVRLLRNQGPPAIIDLPATVSARKYDHNSYWWVNWTNIVAMWRWRNGADLKELRRWYQQRLNRHSST